MVNLKVKVDLMNHQMMRVHKMKNTHHWFKDGKIQSQTLNHHKLGGTMRKTPSRIQAMKPNVMQSNVRPTVLHQIVLAANKDPLL